MAAATLCRFLNIPAAFSLFLLASLASPLSFDLQNITPKDTNVNINVEGDAYITEQGIQVTPYERNQVLNGKTGRAKYVESFHLWDKGTGDLADFNTSFTFNIDSDGDSSFADGLAFFLANFSTPFDKTGTGGGGLGLMNPSLVTPPDPFVAVLFDTYSNGEKTSMTNVSINVNSTLEWFNITAWFNNVTQGQDNNASITYNATSKVLGVVFTGFWDNQYLTGSLSFKVDLRKYLPEFISIGFSAATGLYFEKNTVSSWRFNSTSLRTDSASPPWLPPSPDDPSPPQEEKNKKKGSSKGGLIGLSIGVPVLVALLALGICTFLKIKNMWAEKRNEIVLGKAMDSELEKSGSGPKKLPYSDLAAATNNFAEEQKVGEGGFGVVYRGFLRSLNMDVAVKRVSSGSGMKEYASEVKTISRLRHRNLVPLHGWCHEKGELLLVFEYMPQGNLDSHLFKTKSPLNWGVRYRIAQDLASALSYLHEHWDQCVLHRDIKSSNVLLDKDFNARLADFGLASLVDHGNAPEKTITGGTPGYVAPECNFTFKTSKESDVYSFGIVVLEIACGRRAILVNEPEGVKSLVEWVWDLYGMGKLLQGADPKLGRNFDEEEMERLMMIGLWCAHPDSNCRPKISHALNCLKFQVQLPSLPPEMPKPFYSTSFNVSSSIRQIFEGNTSSSNSSFPTRSSSSASH
ncbi:PREDICTED: L-type lectin-domain containing receptor kinase IX.1-like [Ipomoea nil]|uniref:L-type lectin-domain containing receptor kinase IX.1-like n=1 Tax=Ipomoea nil TaxID=35883 RepID=UPI000900F0E9|nr:PREDICTED: L-type lectin-domain containing receptor kinase IX.1-like [Ipomoea nil]